MLAATSRRAFARVKFSARVQCSSPCAFSAAHPLQLAFRFFSCPPLAARHAFFQLPTLAARLSLFQLPTSCSSPCAFSAAHSLQLAMRFFSCPPLAARHSLFQLPTPCSSPFRFSAAHPLQLTMRFFSCPPLAARHSLFQLPIPCSSPCAMICPCAFPRAFATRPSGCASLALTSSALLACLLLGRAPSPVLRPLHYWSCPVTALPPPCSHSCCRALLSPPSPSRPAHKILPPFLAQHLQVTAFAMCQLLPLQVPAPCRLLCGFSSAARPWQLACSQCFSAKAPAPLLQATGSCQLVSPLTAWRLMSVHTASMLLFALRLSFSCMLRAPRVRCSPALTACRPMFSSAVHLWQLAACVSFHSHLHPYSRGARPFHLTVVFSAAPCQARPSLGHDLHAVSCRPTLTLQQHGSEPYSLLAYYGFERPVWGKARPRSLALVSTYSGTSGGWGV